MSLLLSELYNERKHWKDRLKRMEDEERYELCAFIRNKILRIDTKINKILFKENICR